MSRPDLPSQLNVCIVARQFPIAGRASGFGFLRVIARKMVERGHKVTVLSGAHEQGRREMVQDGVRVFFLLETRGSRVRQDTFRDLVKSKFIDLHSIEPFHIVHSVDSDALKISRYKKSYGVAVAYDVAATQLSRLFSTMAKGHETFRSLVRTGTTVAYQFLRSYYSSDRELLATSDGVFVTSPRERTALERYYLYPDVKIHIVPYGIEIGALEPRERSDELRMSLSIPKSAKIVVTVTDMNEVGEVVNLLEAFEQVVIKRPSSRLIIVGDGPKFKEIEYHMLNLALGSKVIFTGAVKEGDIPDYIALSDVFVNLSSRTTGFEPSLLEAMAQKKIIIGSEVSPMASIVEHAHDGFLIRPADVPELTTLMLDIFAEHISATEIGEAARRKVVDLFDPEKMLVETLEAYYAILKNTGYYRATGTWLSRLQDRLLSYNDSYKRN